MASLPLPRARRAAVRDELRKGVRRHHPSGQCAPETSGDPGALRLRLDEEAARLRLSRIGVTDPAPLPVDGARFVEWLAAGHGADMEYLSEGADGITTTRADPASLLPEARSVIVAQVHYPPPSRPPLGGDLLGDVAAYARGADYHHVIKDRLLLLADALADLVGHPVVARVCVDTAPLLERALAVRAGLGFVGKNTLLLTPGLGSYFLLGELLVDVPLFPAAAEGPFDGCGRCRACLDACPTDAFEKPFVLDARRCVSFLTIENAGDVPRELRAGIGARVFGCDACQSVCPFNRTAHKKPSDPEFAPSPRLELVDLERLLFLGSAPYRTLVRRSALRRAQREQLCRNAAIALGNSGRVEAVRALATALREHPLAQVRPLAAWGLGRLAFDFGIEEAREVLLAERDHPMPEVAKEIAGWFAAEPPGDVDVD